MPISRVASFKDALANHEDGKQTTGVTGTFKQYDYAIIYVVSWHRSSASEPVLNTIEFYDNTYPTRTFTLSLLSTQTRNEAIADGGYCTVSAYGGQYLGSGGDITSGRINITFNGPTTVDEVLLMGTIYRGLPTGQILGTVDDNNGDGTSHDYGSTALALPNAWVNLFAVAWDTETGMGTYTLDDPTGFTSLQTDDVTSAPGTNYSMFIEMWDAGPLTAGTTTPSPDDSSTNACQWITILVPIYGDNSYPSDGGMGVFF